MSAGTVDTIRDACSTLGFSAPPHDRRELKKRFLELAKKYHPDRPGGSAVKMTRLNQAYAMLKKLQDNGCRSPRNGSTSGDGPGSSTDIDINGAPSFVVPGVNVSTSEMWLPWQRQAMGRVEAKGPLAFDSLYRFVKHSRYMERRKQEELAKANEQQKGSTYTTEHLLWERSKRQLHRGRSTNLLSLAKEYVGAKWKAWPETFVASVRFIISGHR